MKMLAGVLAAAIALPLAAATKPKEPTVTLDVKDAETRVILRSIKKQCGIRNLVVDPNVPDAKGTFLFNDVPCRTALSVVLHTFGLHAVTESSNMVQVEVPRP